MSRCASALAVVFQRIRDAGPRRPPSRSPPRSIRRPSSATAASVWSGSPAPPRDGSAQGNPVTDLRASDFQIRDSGISSGSQPVPVRRLTRWELPGAALRCRRRLRAIAPSSPAGVAPATSPRCSSVRWASTPIPDNSFDFERRRRSISWSVSASDTRFAVYLLADGVSTVAGFRRFARCGALETGAMTARIPQSSGSEKIVFGSHSMPSTPWAATSRGSTAARASYGLPGAFPRLTLTPVRGPGGAGRRSTGLDRRRGGDARRTAQSLAQRGVTLHIEDARGLRSGREGVPAQSRRPRGGSSARRAASRLNNGFIGTMTRLAEITGGRCGSIPTT